MDDAVDIFHRRQSIERRIVIDACKSSERNIRDARSVRYPGTEANKFGGIAERSDACCRGARDVLVLCSVKDHVFRRLPHSRTAFVRHDRKKFR
jgi:hypothetical protein